MEEVQSQNSEQVQVAPEEVQGQDSNSQPSNSNVDDRQDRNWKVMRDRQKDLERELRLQREMNEKLMQMASQLAPPKQQEVDEIDSINDDEFLPKGKVKKLVEKEKDKIIKHAVEELEKKFEQQKQSQFLDRLKKQYSDFDDHVNPETLALLEEKEPELAQTIADLKDPYKIGVQSYKYIKALNIASETTNQRRVKEVEKKIEKNEKTVPSPQVYDKRPMAQAFKMTETEKTALYKEMMDYASQAGFSY